MFFIGILLKERSKKDGKHLDLFRVCFELASSFMVEQPVSQVVTCNDTTKNESDPTWH